MSNLSNSTLNLDVNLFLSKSNFRIKTLSGKDLTLCVIPNESNIFKYNFLFLTAVGRHFLNFI